MASHKYKVGQVVDYSPSPAGTLLAMREYKILKLLTHEDGEQLYRIKTITEPVDRIAKESEIVLWNTGTGIRGNTGRNIIDYDPHLLPCAAVTGWDDRGERLSAAP